MTSFGRIVPLAETSRGEAFVSRVSGIEATLQVFKKYQSQIDAAADQLLEDYAWAIHKRSQYYCPVRDPAVTPPHNIPGGSLKESGTVEKGKTPGEWVVSYGGRGLATPRDPWYAVYVHEIDRNHAPPTRWKFLEAAVHELLPDMVREFGPKITVSRAAVAEDGRRYGPEEHTRRMPTEENTYP